METRIKDLTAQLEGIKVKAEYIREGLDDFSDFDGCDAEIVKVEWGIENIEDCIEDCALDALETRLWALADALDALEKDFNL